MGYATQILVLLTVYIQLRISSSNLNDECSDDDPPSFTSDGQPPGAVLVDLQGDGDNLVLPCRVTGTPTPTVSWFRNNTLIDQTSIMADGTLSIRVTEAEAPREGTNYYCVATNVIGPGNSTVSALRSRDVIISSSSFREPEVATIEGGDVALECAFNPSNPAPNITWFANNMMITETGRIEFLEGGRYLYIQSLNAAEREMVYHCVVNFNGLSIRPPTTYTLNTTIDPGMLMVYKNQSTVSGGVGVEVNIAFAAAAVEADGTTPVNTFLNCVDNTLIDFGLSSGTTTPLMLLPPAENMAQVNFGCVIFTPSGLRSDVMGVITVSDSPASITVPIPDDPSLTDRNRSVGGGPVEYSCEASGRPAPTITWYYNGAVVQSGSGGVVVDGDGTLTISAPQVSHSGIYQCFARNQFGEDSRAWILEVADPVIGAVILNSTLEIMRKTQGDLLYAPNGTPDLTIITTLDSTTIRGVDTCGSCPQVQWKVNGTNIVMGDRDYTISIPSNNSLTRPYTFSLTITSLTAETSGNYSARVTLPNFDITEESPGLFITSLCVPVITDSDMEVSANVGSELELQCMILEICPTMVSWSRNGGSIPMNDRITALPVMNGVAILRIESVEEEDAGMYTCTASSDDGSVSKTIEVNIPGGGSSSINGIIGGILGAVGAVLLLVGTILIVVAICIRSKNRKHSVEESDGKPKKKESRVYTDPPHATATVTPTTATDLSSAKEKEAVEMSNVGGVYADPSTIPHETAVTGQVYAVSTKKGPKQQEQAEQPPPDAVYSMPDMSKKQKNQELMYAQVEATRSPRDGNKHQQLQQDTVLYSDIAHS